MRIGVRIELTSVTDAPAVTRAVLHLLNAASLGGATVEVLDGALIVETSSRHPAREVLMPGWGERLLAYLAGVDAGVTGTVSVRADIDAR